MDDGVGRIGRRVREALDPRPPAEPPPGPLTPATTAVLRAAAEALLGGYVGDAGPYEELLVRRAERLPGLGALYDAFAVAAGGEDFVAATYEQRLAVLDRIARAGSSGSRMAWLRAVLLRRRALQFERAVVVPVFAHFARTDAWLAAGYPCRPGAPRHLPALAG